MFFIWKDRGDPIVCFEYKKDFERCTVAEIWGKWFGASISLNAVYRDLKNVKLSPLNQNFTLPSLRGRVMCCWGLGVNFLALKNPTYLSLEPFEKDFLF